MDIPIADLMDEQACYQRLLQILHPHGLHCPRCGAEKGLGVHRRHRQPVLDYQCGGCGRVFNLFTDTVLAGTHKSPAQVLLILRGVGQGTSTAQLSRELHLSRVHLLELRHRLQQTLHEVEPVELKNDRELEADEMYQNAGKKRMQTSQRHGQAAASSQPQGGPRRLETGPSAGPGVVRP